MVRAERNRLCGCVEVDEIYVGGKERGAPGRSRGKKALVAVAAEEAGAGIGRIRLRHVPDALAASLKAFILEAVEPGSSVRTDGWSSYSQLHVLGYRHRKAVTRGDPQRLDRDFPRVQSRGRPAEALAAGDAPRRCGEAPPELLPRRIHLPVQPQDFQFARPAVSQALATGGRHRPDPANSDHRTLTQPLRRKRSLQPVTQIPPTTTCRRYVESTTCHNIWGMWS